MRDLIKYNTNTSKTLIKNSSRLLILFSINRLLGVHLNVTDEVNENFDFLLTAEHLKAWEKANGPLPHRSVILVNFGWAHKFGDRRSYYNNEVRPYR